MAAFFFLKKKDDGFIRLGHGLEGRDIPQQEAQHWYLILFMCYLPPGEMAILDHLSSVFCMFKGTSYMGLEAT